MRFLDKVSKLDCKKIAIAEDGEIIGDLRLIRWRELARLIERFERGKPLEI